MNRYEYEGRSDEKTSAFDAGLFARAVANANPKSILDEGERKELSLSSERRGAGNRSIDKT